MMTPMGARANLAGVGLPSTPWAATTDPRRSSPAPSITPRRTPRTACSSSATLRRSRAIAGAPPGNVEVVPASQVIEMHEHPALALREKKDSSITVACDLVKDGRADAVMTAGHTGAAMAAAVLRIGRLPGVDRPALARPDGSRGPALRPPRHRRQPRLVAGEPGLSTRRWARSSPSASSGIPSPRVALLSIGEEKGKGDARIQRTTELLDASGPRLRRQRRGQGPRLGSRRRRRHRRRDRQRRDQVLRGPVDVHLRPVAGRVPARHPGQARRTCCCGRASGGSGRSSTTSAPAARRSSA